MPILKNQRHELFCQELAKGKNGDDAYVAAGYLPNRHNASRLKTTETITARVLELQGKRTDRLTLSRQYVVDALLENAEKALGRRPVKLTRRVKIDKDEYADEIAEVFVYEGQVANAAIKLAGNELGMFIDRKDFRVVNEFDKLTDEELSQQLTKTAQLLLESKVIDHEDGET